MTQRISHAIGTTVRIIETGRVSVVSDVSIFQGELAYAVGGTAWFEHSDLEWVADPTLESLQEAFVHAADEDYEDEDEDYEDEDEDEDEDSDGEYILNHA